MPAYSDYSVISYAVAQRTRGIGIRVALGAQQESVRRMFVRQGMVLALMGVVGGVAVAAGLMRVMASLLFEVSAVDPITYAAVSVGLVRGGAHGDLRAGPPRDASRSARRA